jgi:hypothetical protein
MEFANTTFRKYRISESLDREHSIAIISGRHHATGRPIQRYPGPGQIDAGACQDKRTGISNLREAPYQLRL